MLTVFFRQLSMGIGASTRHSQEYTNNSALEVAMPAYYNDEHLSNQEKSALKLSWRLITSDSAPGYLELMKEMNQTHEVLPYQNCAEYLTFTLYEQLFDVEYTVKQLCTTTKALVLYSVQYSFHFCFKYD